MDKGKFKRLLAAFLTCATLLYVTAITFCTVPEANIGNANSIMGFLLGVTLATVVGYYFGDAEKKE